MVDNAPSVAVLRCSKNPVDARDKNIQQRAESFSLAGALSLNFGRAVPAPAATSFCLLFSGHPTLTVEGEKRTSRELILIMTGRGLIMISKL